MLRLNKESIKDKESFKKIGITVPNVDFDAVRRQTAANPVWAHIGPGNIFRAYIAGIAQKLIEDGKMDSGITAVVNFDYQLVEKAFAPYDGLALRVVMHPDGRLDKDVIASVGEYVKAERGNAAEWTRLKEIFTAPSLQMVSFTITEKGYHIRGMDGSLSPAAAADLADGAGGEVPRNGIAILTALLLARYEAGAQPIAMVSMDNFSHNGSKLHESVAEFARGWVKGGSAPSGFADYIDDPKKVSFPWTVIDKITPRPAPRVAEELRASGFGDTEISVTDRDTYIAPFVNAEGAEYLVIEDAFPNGRPPLELAGVHITDRATVDLFERMKVCTCLNPLHTAMSIFGCLLGYQTIADEMKDSDIVALIKRIGYAEGMPVVSDPGIVKPIDFIDEVVNNRLTNPFIPDTPQRIMVDTSRKMGIRFGETVKMYAARPNLSVTNLEGIALTVAGWCRYLLGVDDNGEVMEVSSDPLLDELRAILAGITLGDPASAEGKLRPLLSNANIFNTDLYAAGIGTMAESYFKQLLAGKGAVRRMLNNMTAKWGR